MQAENQKLRKEISEKTNKVQQMDIHLEEASKECKKLTTITSMYSDMLGIQIDPIQGRDKEFIVSVNEQRQPFRKIFEARVETIKVFDRIEWRVVLNKLPLNPFIGHSIGEQLIYQESNISNFFSLVREAALLS